MTYIGVPFVYASCHYIKFVNPTTLYGEFGTFVLRCADYMTITIVLIVYAIIEN